MRFEFIVPGKVIPLARARHGKHGNVYTPTRSTAYQREIWIAAQKAGIWQLHFGLKPVWVGIRVYVKPKRASSQYPTSRPDIDNYLKQVLDALAPAYHDDAQVVGILRADKLYGEPRLEVTITDAADRWMP